MRVLSFFGIITVLGLSACMEAHSPAPVTVYGTSQGPGSAGVHNVSAGDTLWTVSQRYNIVMRDIVFENGLSAPFELRVGQRLILPPPREYRVRGGDSVSTVARLFDVSASEVVRINDLEAPYRLSAGQVLRLPSPVKPSPKPAEIAGDAMEPVIRETLAMRKDDGGQDQAQQKRVAIKIERLPTPAEKPVRGAPVVRDPVEKTPVVMAQGDVVKPAHKPVVPRKGPKVKKRVSTPKRASSKFLKPVNGKIVSGYGAKKNGLHNDGINIAAARGASVQAAENGVVVYAGNGLKGSGNLILVRHDDRWMTAYGHLDRIKVANGAVVKRGQAIGTVGSTGAVSSPQLHFEVRRGTKALNPKPYLE